RPAVCGLLLVAGAGAAELPGRYYRLMEAGLSQVSTRLKAEPSADLETLEAKAGWRHFPSALLVAAVLYSSPHPSNRLRGDRQTLELAAKIGDLLALEQERGRYATRLDHHRDTYMWVESYRLLERELGEERRERWRRALFGNLTPLAVDVAKRQDYPWYNSPYIGTSPNHYSLWSSTLYLAGRMFGNAEW